MTGNYDHIGLMVEAWRKEHFYEKVVFTNGVFDLLHPGHVDFLYRASTLGNYLIVGVNIDETVKRLKGPNRPIYTQAERLMMIGSLSFVDKVVLFSESTPIELIKAVKPDIHVKGDDYSPEAMPETPVVKELGGRVVILPLIEGYSTTELIKKIKSLP